MSSPPSILVYDGRKAVFRAAVDGFTYGMDDLVAVPWESAPVQRFLEAQFGGHPFIFVLVDGESVHVGKTAVGRTLIARGAPTPIARAFERLYPPLAAPFGRLVHGDAPADVHGTFAIDPDARVHVDAIRRQGTPR